MFLQKNGVAVQNVHEKIFLTTKYTKHTNKHCLQGVFCTTNGLGYTLSPLECYCMSAVGIWQIGGGIRLECCLSALYYGALTRRSFCFTGHGRSFCCAWDTQYGR